MNAVRQAKSAKRHLAVLPARLPELQEQYRVKSLGLFGSFVRGEETAKSDLDVLVEFSETPTLVEFIELEEHLAGLLGRKIDLVTPAALKGRIGQRILSEVIRL